MLQEKRISSKINYDVLKSLNVKSLDTSQTPKETVESGAVLTKRPETISLFGSPERRYYICMPIIILTPKVKTCSNYHNFFNLTFVIEIYSYFIRFYQKRE